MASARDLAERKQLLLAESALYRAKLRYQLVARRAKGPSFKLPLLGMLLMAGGRARTAGWIALATRAVSLARAGIAILAVLRARRAR